MGFANFLITKLIGRDILNSEKELKESLEAIQKEKDSLVTQNAKLQESGRMLRSSLDTIQNDRSLLVKQKDKLQESVEEKQGQIISLNTEKEKLKSQIAQLSNITDTKDHTISDLTEKVETLTVQNRSKQGTIMNHVKKINALASELEDLKGKYDTLLSQKSESDLRVETVEKEKKTLNEQNKSLTEKISSLEQKLAEPPTIGVDEVRELEAQIQRNEETIQKQNREIEILKINEQAEENRFSNLCEKLETANNEKDSLEEKLKDLQEKFNNISKKYSNLEVELAAKNQNNQNEVEAVLPQDSMPIPATVTDLEGNDSKAADVTNVKQPTMHKDTSTIMRIKKPQKTKEENVIEQSDGSIIDFPKIVNDSSRQTQRTIEYVYDENNRQIYADEFFNRSAEEIARISRNMAEAEQSGTAYWTCGLCHCRVKAAHRTYNGKESLFFIHTNRDSYCPWLTQTTSSKDIEKLLDESEIITEETFEEKKPKSRELKEKIFTLLTSYNSEKLGISDVRMDEIIRSNVPYMKWRRPDISFLHNGRKVVIILQKKSHDLDLLVDRDIFFRLNDIQILWVFGSDSDSSYDYMRKLNYHITMFDNHRNVFVFDKEAQSVSEENEVLYLKCNWLNADESWHFRLDNTGANGKMISINDLIYDDEYCKPYYYDANGEYFTEHPEAREAYFAMKKTRDELKKEIEEKWTRDKNYEEALTQMRQRYSKAELYCVNSLWGFRFNTTILIPPIFTVRPKDLSNDCFLVCQGNNFGIVNRYGQKIINWDGSILCDDMDYDAQNNRIFIARNGKWGVVNLLGEELISASYQAIKNWSANAYRVKENGKWGLCDINNRVLAECKYNRIDELGNTRALAVRTHPIKMWETISGYIDENGKELFSAKLKQIDGCSLVQVFELWGIVDGEGNPIVPCVYEEILSWAENKYRVKENGKWNIINIHNNTMMLPNNYDSISELRNGVAQIIFANVESAIDVNGNEVAQEIIQLQDGLKKTKIAGKWGIVNVNDEVVINHMYDEIGSFRNRMIGVINDKIIKLDAKYSYPIYISGTLTSTEGKRHYFNIAGVKCVISEGFLKQAGKSITQICDKHKECKQLAFANLIFNKQQYLLRVLKPEYLTRKLSHGDGQDDFLNGEELIGKIVHTKQNFGIIKKIKVHFDDGRESMVPRRFFNSPLSIDDYKIGDSIKLKKVGFDEENDQTIWEVL